MSELNSKRAVILIGIGDDGCVGMSSKAANAMSRCQILAGGERHLSFFPDFHGERIFLNGNIDEFIEKIAGFSQEQNVGVLASGDPMFYGIGSKLIETVGREHVEVIPQPGAMQLAFSKIGLKWDDAEWISLHGRKNNSFITVIKRMSKVVFFTDMKMTPSVIAKKMNDYGETKWSAWLCENLSGAGENIRYFENVGDVAKIEDISPLNVMIILRNDPEWKPLPLIVHFHEDLYAKRMPSRGLITKKEIRAFSISSLGLRKNSIVWDVGAASGAVAIECALICDRGAVYAIEMNSESVSHCMENAKSFSVDNVFVVEGRAPEIFSKIEEDPDAVFIGGSNGSLREIIKRSYERLSVGGRIVVNAITFENIQESYECFREMEIVPEIIQLNISRAAPLSRFMRYEAQNPIHMFCAEKNKNRGYL